MEGLLTQSLLVPVTAGSPACLVLSAHLSRSHSFAFPPSSSIFLTVADLMLRMNLVGPLQTISREFDYCKRHSRFLRFYFNIPLGYLTIQK